MCVCVRERESMWMCVCVCEGERSRSRTPALPERPAATQGPSWEYIKVIFKRCCQLLTIKAYRMGARTSQGLQERAWDAPTKGLEWECGETERDMEGVGEAGEAVGSAVYSFVATST